MGHIFGFMSGKSSCVYVFPNRERVSSAIRLAWGWNELKTDIQRVSSEGFVPKSVSTEDGDEMNEDDERKIEDYLTIHEEMEIFVDGQGSVGDSNLLSGSYCYAGKSYPCQVNPDWRWAEISRDVQLVTGQTVSALSVHAFTMDKNDDQTVFQCLAIITGFEIVLAIQTEDGIFLDLNIKLIISKK